MKKYFPFFLLFFITACTAWPPPQLPGLDEVLPRWQEQPYNGGAIYMIGEINLKLPDRQYNAEHTLLINERGQFRLDILGPFEKRLFSITCNGNYLLAIFYDDNKAYFGQATPANLARLLGMDLNPVHIFMLLSGRAPFWLDGETINSYGRISASSNSGLLLLMLFRPDAPLQSITFDIDTQIVREATLQEDDGRLFDIIYRRFDQNSGLPSSLNLSASDGRAMDIYNDLAQWTEVSPDFFSLPAVPGTMQTFLLP
ncbi:MAG: hypothetical protein LBJ14_11045 [Desulfarculales bacterium]|jgi:hypothetical protein|nr:hypothetical protein [Desulfarculales bacterium]